MPAWFRAGRLLPLAASRTIVLIIGWRERRGGHMVAFPERTICVVGSFIHTKRRESLGFERPPSSAQIVVDIANRDNRGPTPAPRAVGWNSTTPPSIESIHVYEIGVDRRTMRECRMLPTVVACDWYE